jgi:hypothetical protein
MMKSIPSIFLLLVLFFPAPAAHGGLKQGRGDYSNCLECHMGIRAISKNHSGLPCISCHIKPEDRKTSGLRTHKIIIRNPSVPSLVKTFCGKCHSKEIERVSTSLHSTLAGIINQTRYLWGAQKTAAPAIFGLGDALQPLPEPDKGIYPDTPALLVDDFLRRRCLRCHIYGEGSRGRGLYRAGGCAACHVLYADDGLYRGKDRAIPREKGGYPAAHSFTTRVTNNQCLHCHNHNYAGADYEGLFEHDYSSTYDSPILDGKPVPRIYGMHYHHLAEDVHAERGLWCIDCHQAGDIMGDGKVYSYELEVPMRTCTACHGGFRGKRPGPDVAVMNSAGGKETHTIPLFSKKPVAHSILEHERVRCSACHAQWAFEDFGLSVIREDASQGYKWYGLTAQGDPSLERRLRASMEDPAGTPVFSRDLITGELRGGIWSEGWRFRRWEWFPLGVDQRNRYTILRPLHQYLVSYNDRLGNIALDSAVPERGDGSGRGWAWAPYVPHTIAPVGRQCDSCHRNPVAVGLGPTKEKGGDVSLFVPSPPPVSSMRLLTKDERERLLNPSKRWGKERLRSLITTGQAE